jgi:quinol monooxygenase YgiN
LYAGLLYFESQAALDAYVTSDRFKGFVQSMSDAWVEGDKPVYSQQFVVTDW